LAETVQWINITGNHPVSFHLKLLESNGTEPYMSLAGELRKLPDLNNATAVAKITYLALNATNPEVKEAFELMMQGGTPSPSDFQYSVPLYNTELEVLYWLACQNEFKRDDTLALAIAMVNGFWVTIGDEPVRQAVYKDASDMLIFGRETSEMQRASDLQYNLEAYPLEAKIAWAWTGNDVGTHGPHALSGLQSLILSGVQRSVDSHRLDLKGYNWNTVSVATLRSIRKDVSDMGWWNRDVNMIVQNVEEYFSFSGFNAHWKYVSSFDEKIEADGEMVPARNLNNADFEYDYYLKNGYGIGVCEDEMALTDAFLKSWAVPSLALLTYWNEGNSFSGHTHVIYYDPSSNLWKGYYKELSVEIDKGPVDFYVFRPPIRQAGYVPRTSNGSVTPPPNASVPSSYSNGEVNTTMFCRFLDTTQASKVATFSNGVLSAQMKQWLLYS
jgi:hypothetical protein